MFFLLLACVGDPVSAASRFYAIQISSNRHLSTAADETARLKGMGFQAFYRYETTKGHGNWYKVYVGQFPSMDKAKQAVDAMQHRLTVDYTQIRQITDPNIALRDTSQNAPSQGVETFTLHVSSFRTEPRARDEVRRLAQLGLNAFYKKIMVQGTTWYRVYFGNYPEKKRAREKGYMLKQAGIISFYNPVADVVPPEEVEAQEDTVVTADSADTDDIGETSQPEITIKDATETIHHASGSLEEEDVTSRTAETETSSVVVPPEDTPQEIPAISNAEPATRITFKNLLTELLATHDMIKHAHEKLKSADHGMAEASSSRYPSLNLSADLGHQKIRWEDAGSTDEWRNSSTVSAKQLLTDFGTTKSRIGKSQAMLDRAKYEFQATRQKILLEGITAYLNVIKSRENLKYFKKSEANIKEQTGIEESLVQKGAGLSSNVLQAKSQLANAQALVTEAKGQMEIARNRFRAIFKKTLTDEMIENLENPALRLSPRPIDALIDVAMTKNPYMSMAEAETDLYTQDVRLKQAAFYPRCNLFAENTYSNNEDGFDGYKNETLLGVELSYNLFNGGGDKAAMAMARSDLSAQDSMVDATRYLIEEQVRNAWQNLNTLRHRTTLLETQSNIAAEFLILARKERTLGNRSLLDILNGEITYINAVSNAISSKIDTKIAAYNLLYTTGELNIGLL